MSFANNCEVCNKVASKSCSQCRRVFYCSVKCQKKDWKKHRLKCSSKETSDEVGNGLPPPSPKPSVTNDSDEAMPPPPPGMDQLKEAVEAMNSSGFVAPEPLTPMELSELYKTNVNARLLRDKVDDIIELVNEGNELLYSSPGSASAKLKLASSTASKILSQIDKFKPKRGEPVTPEQQLTMSLFVDVSGALSQALTSLGTIKEMTGSPREAILLYQGALPQCEVMNDVQGAFTCRVGIGNCHKALGEFERAIQILKLEHETARANKDEIGLAICCNGLSKCYTSLPFSPSTSTFNLNAALSYALEDVAICRKDDDYPAQLGSALIQVGACHRLLFDFDLARQCYEEGIEMLKAGDDFSAELMAALEFSELCLADVGDCEKAYELGQRGLKIAERLKDSSNIIESLNCCLRSKLCSKEEKLRLKGFVTVGEEGGGGGGITCLICHEKLDFEGDDVFLSKCGCSYHESCFLEHVGKDQLFCPGGESCKGDSDLRKRVKGDPQILLRLAEGNRQKMYYF
ncbi:hypothetical protein TrVE_jg5251 [Triparma verrucosa]|uniref:MYND-type domain-containing protein n=1 Tax=Triparma verrucosa TaxID=1606542 RepID=A0A9W7B5X4_9STRA|nr:hypothetical protein TrVE_jg5251 [Triparma verrucosa]